MLSVTLKYSIVAWMKAKSSLGHHYKLPTRVLCCRPDDLSKTCWKCGSRSCACSVFCMKCHYIQDVKICDYFDLFKILPTFSIDIPTLERMYKSLQKQLHPDLYTTKSIEEQNVSLEGSSTVNQAYQTLKDPILRSMYLLSRNNINIFDEGSSYANPTLMVYCTTEVFELREEMEELNDRVSLRQFVRRIESDIRDIYLNLQKQYDDRDLKGFSSSAVRLKYFSKILEEAVAKKESIEIFSEKTVANACH